MRSTLENLLRDGHLWCAESDNNKRSDKGVILSPDLKINKTSAKRFVAPFGVPDIDSSLPHGGLPSGYIHEWFSSPYENTLQPSGSLLTLIAGKALSTTEKRGFIIWIGRSCWPTAYLLDNALPENSLQNCLFIDPPDFRLHLWSIETALRSSAVLAVIASCENISFPISKRFSLAAEKGNSLGLFIRKDKELNSQSASCSKWRLKPAPSPSLSPRWELELVKLKGARSPKTRWTIEYSNELENEEISLHIPSDVVSKSGPEAAPEQQRA